ncbi:hypothetical protein OG225_07395 [Nocardia sp. NBC_01377]|uniref:hypothetical protein n=1 Tax=Nocardia sp. NBC_01377 TaxID=2903595 RepID=UPI003253389E
MRRPAATKRWKAAASSGRVSTVQARRTRIVVCAWSTVRGVVGVVWAAMTSRSLSGRAWGLQFESPVPGEGRAGSWVA